MCIDDNPLLRAMPYIISGIILLIITLLLHVLKFVKKWNKKSVLLLKIITLCSSGILFYLAFVEYNIRYRCV